jgi:hypothetical protein
LNLLFDSFAGFEKAADGRSRDIFSEAGNDATGDEDVLVILLWSSGRWATRFVSNREATIDLSLFTSNFLCG